MPVRNTFSTISGVTSPAGRSRIGASSPMKTESSNSWRGVSIARRVKNRSGCRSKLPASSSSDAGYSTSLPKGFFRSRHYGNHANSNRAEYLQQARALLGLAKDKEESLADEPESVEWNPDVSDAEEPSAVELDSSVPRCPNCGQAMVKVDFERRPSWRITMNGPYRPSWYDT